MSVLHIKDENGNWVPVTTIQGDPGHSPVITATKNGTTTTIKSDGVAIATINDGAEGVDGQDAAPLTITSQALDEDGNRVVVFSDGTSVTIPKGQQGDAGTTDYNELTNKPTIPTKTSELTNDSGFYQRPQDGIPLQDLSTDVQNKLRLASEIYEDYVLTSNLL